MAHRKKLTVVQHLFEVKYKLLAFFGLLLYVVLLFNAVLAQFRTNDPIPQVQVLGRFMRKEFRHVSAKVRAGLHIENFPTFNMVHNKFIIDGLVWFEFDRNKIMLETVEKFSFDNGRILKKSPAKIETHGDTIVARYNVLFEIKSDLDFHRFPLEDHRLTIMLTNDFVSPNEMYFDDYIKSISLSVSPNIFTSDWKIHELRTFSGFTQLHFDEFNKQRTVQSPKAVFMIDFAKDGTKKVLIIFIPIFAAVFLALFTFLMSFNSYRGKFILSTSGVTALLGYRFVIEQLMPPVGYLTVTDKLYIFFLFFAFAIFIFQLLLVRQYMLLTERGKIQAKDLAVVDHVELLPKQTERINTMVYFAAVAVFAVVVTWFVMF